MGGSPGRSRARGAALALALSLAALPSAAQTPVDSLSLQQTIHATVPESLDGYWFAPGPRTAAPDRSGPLADAALAYTAGNFTLALTSARQALSAGGPLASYAQLYVGLSQLRLSNAAEANKAFEAVLDRKPEGNLYVAAMMGRAEAAELRGDAGEAADLYEKLAAHKSAAPDDVLTRLGRSALAAGDRKRAAAAFQRV